jgi:hypothetical protein
MDIFHHRHHLIRLTLILFLASFPFYTGQWMKSFRRPRTPAVDDDDDDNNDDDDDNNNNNK